MTDMLSFTSSKRKKPGAQRRLTESRDFHPEKLTMGHYPPPPPSWGLWQEPSESLLSWSSNFPPPPAAPSVGPGTGFTEASLGTCKRNHQVSLESLPDIYRCPTPPHPIPASGAS